MFNSYENVYGENPVIKRKERATTAARVDIHEGKPFRPANPPRQHPNEKTFMPLPEY